MLETCFAKRWVAPRLRQSYLGAYLDSFAAADMAVGYAGSTVRAQLKLLWKFGRWLEQRRILPSDLHEEHLKQFLAESNWKDSLGRGYGASLRRFLDHLRQRGVVVSAEIPIDDSPTAQLLRKYETHLVQERGLASVTVSRYLWLAGRFLREQWGGGALRFDLLRSVDIEDTVCRHAPSMTPKHAQLMGSALRSFLRFLLQRGDITADLATCVPTVASWRLATLPKYLSASEVGRVLKSCNRSTAVGRRDYAMLLLFAHLGLRAGEVVALELDDIDWRAGELVVRGKGSVHDRLPLMQDVGEALAASLRDRPRTSSRCVFLRSRAPFREMRRASSASTIVRRALLRAKLNPSLKGAHLLRHSLATGMLRRGATMAEIAEVLRHRSPRTTEIYAKVDLAGLRTVAQPWPLKAGAR